MKPPEILEASYNMLRDNPGMFLPKIISSLLGSLWFIGFLMELGPLYIYFVTAPVVALMGFFVTVLLASMVKNVERENMINVALKETFSVWKEILASVFLLFIIMVAVQIPAVLGVVYFIINSNLAVLTISVLFSVLMFFAVIFLAFFYPISLIDDKGLKQSIRDSAGVSMSNKKEVVGITLFAFLLLGAASLANSTLGQAAGLAGFIVFRLISAVISTYIYVVSPTYYLEASS